MAKKNQANAAPLETEVAVEGKKSKNVFLKIIIWLFVAAGICLGTFFFTTNFIMRWPISGSSMTATVLDGDDVLVFKTKKINYDDVIIFFCPEIKNHDSDEGTYLCKRVIGKAGDEISVKYDSENQCYHVYRNGTLLPEDKIYAPMTSMGSWQESTVIVPEGKYYVLGDNRNNSTDSSLPHRIFADEDNVVGKVFLRVSSSKSFGIVK